jgi:predicted GNAT family N-acyltransferase
VTWQIAFVDDYAPCIALRRAVFIEEQGISEADEIDQFDVAGLHMLATIDGRPVGTARLLIEEGLGKIGRICVLSDCRGIGLGKALVEYGAAFLSGLPEVKYAKLGAQDHAIGFYEKLGFEAVGPFYDDAGIPHRDMIRTLA